MQQAGIGQLEGYKQYGASYKKWQIFTKVTLRPYCYMRY